MCLVSLKFIVVSFIVLLCVICTTTKENEEQCHVHRLEQMNVFEDQITLSGFSAGASMSTQLHVSHSSLFSGVALFSQVFYRCGPRSLAEFGIRCSHVGKEAFPWNVKYSIEDAKLYGSLHLIDDPFSDKMKKQRVFIWIGDMDEYIPLNMAKMNVDFYSSFITNQSQISLTVEKAKHLYPTANYGGGCDEDAEKNYYLGNCNYSGAYHSLHFLLGDQIQIPKENIKLSLLTLFNQSEFHPGSEIRNAAMGTVGYIYIPKACNKQKCLLHFNFHGCNEWSPSVAEQYILNSGLLEVAEQNNIIIVFPLTTKVPQNMGGCWDFYSYTGEYFATKQGTQIKVIHRMLQRILHGSEDNLLISR